MGAIISTIALGLAWCACSAASTLCTACLDNTTPGSTGRKRSVLLFVLSVALSLLYQYALGPALGPDGNQYIIHTPYIGSHLVHSWNDSCSVTYPDSTDLQSKCRGYHGTYRVGATTTLFFLAAAIGAYIKPGFNREVWPAKFAIYLFFVGITILIPNTPWYTPIYVHISRIIAGLFLIFQQIILIDLAYGWNEWMVDKSHETDIAEGYGAGKRWLRGILVCCVTLFLTTLLSISLLFHYFGGCPTNNTFIALTLIFVVITTTVQLLSEQGSLLTSAVLSLYVTYLCYSAVSKNPNGDCNPMLYGNHENGNGGDHLGMIVGVTLTFLSLVWTGWAYAGNENLLGGGGGGGSGGDADNPLLLYENNQVTGGVANEPDTLSANPSYGTESSSSPVLCQLNIVLAFIACWVSMVLTGWGTISSVSEDDVSNPDKGTANMWIIMTSQWIALCLYLWTLIAPSLFPDREF